MVRDSSWFMELPLHFPSPLSLSSSTSASSSSTTSATSTNISTNIALLKACDEQTAHSYTNLTTSNAPNHHHLYHGHCIQVYDHEQAISKKRKQLASSMQEEAHVPTIHRMYSPQRTVDDDQLYCHGVSIVKDDQISCEEEVLQGCTTPPHVQSTCNYAAHDHHDCSTRPENHNEDLDPITADLAELCAQTSASIGGNQVISNKGEILLQNGDHGIESIMCGCSIIRRGPPPAPRKPKAKPRIHKSDDRLNFFIPPGPDLELFFSSSSTAPPPTNIYKQAHVDDA